MKYKAIELFAGIGGFRLACENLGIETIWANDIDSNAVTVYKDRFGKDSIIQGDINTLIEAIPHHNILTGGFPCQPFSKAGKKKGIQDYRGTLFESIVKILELHKPTFFVLENVNSLLYLDKGENYRTILNALTSLDYKIEWSVLNAQMFGLPQNRERVIITGVLQKETNVSYFLDKTKQKKVDAEKISRASHFNEWYDIVNDKIPFANWGMAYNGKYITAEVKQEKNLYNVSLKNILQEKVDKSFDFTEGTLERIKNSVYVNKFYDGVQILYNQAGGARMGYSIFGTEGVAPALTASTSRHYERYKIGDSFRRLTNIEYARLQGFPDEHCSAVSPYVQYKLYGNAVPHQMVQYALSLLINDNYNLLTYPSLSLF